MTKHSTRALGVTIAVLLAAGSLAAANATTARTAMTSAATDDLPEVPVLHRETTRGDTTVTSMAPTAVAAKVVDGQIDDWTGTGTGYAGTVVRSHGELVYTDHLFDAYGADDGNDAARLALLAPVVEAVPGAYRVDAMYQSNLAGELGIDVPDELKADEQYGDLDDADSADLHDVRLAVDDSTLYALARTTTMHDKRETALLLLIDDDPATPVQPVEIPFHANVVSPTADLAILVADGVDGVFDLRSGVPTPVDVAIPAAFNPDGWTNAIEVAIPRALLHTDHPRVAIASGLYDEKVGGVAAIANVAFRTAEPVRIWMDQQQAMALHAHTVEPFFHDVDFGALAAGATDTFRLGPGYHERVFRSSELISSEGGEDGIFQHYGVYLPENYDRRTPLPLTFWLHWRGGKANSAGALAPRIYRDMGDERGGIVVGIRGRGSSTWYLGEGLVDFNEVWDDIHSRLTVDWDRVYVSGHSMGGWGSYLLPILYPDRFAGSMPVSPPVTQGAWTGVDFAGCDDLQYEDYTPCYIETNDSDPRAQLTRRMLENVRHVPLAIYQGAIDELVPVSGTVMQETALLELGYRHRFYLFPPYEHYTHPVVDEWADGVRYLDGFRRNANPARVTYRRDMVFERSVEQGPSQHEHPNTTLSFAFDRAYWMSELTPADSQRGVARFDGSSRGIAEPATIAVPEGGGPASLGQVGPFVMMGLAWVVDPLAVTPAPTNGFDVTLSGARAVRLDLARMNLSSARPLAGTVTTDSLVELRLAGAWTEAPAVTVNGRPAATRLAGGVLAIAIPAGTNTVEVG